MNAADVSPKVEPRSHNANGGLADGISATHVLYLIDSLNGWGGAETALLRLVKYLPRDRYRCTVGTFAVHPRFDGLTQFPCPVQVFPLRRTYDNQALRTAFRLGSFIRRERVRIVHTFFESSDLWGGLVARLSGCPIVVSSRRDMGIHRSSMHKIAYPLLAPMFDQVQAVSEAVRQFCIREDRVRPEKVVTVYNGVEREHIAANSAETTRESLNLAGASHVIATVGNIRPVKAIEVVIHCAAAVRHEFPDAVFLIVGRVHDRSYFENMQALTVALKLQNTVRFLTDINNVAPALKICDVFCLLSHSEGFSNALIEAMACGLPCVVSRVGGNSEIVAEGRTGFVVPPGNPGEAARRISVLLRDRSLSRTMGAAGRQCVEESYTTRRMVNLVAAQYERLLSGQSACTAEPRELGRMTDRGSSEYAFQTGELNEPAEN
jgi:glycosyltransferase involved in cell wall biosynthesis